jgi:hypothetical protein
MIHNFFFFSLDFCHAFKLFNLLRLILILDVVGRQVMRSDGVYVDGSIQGIKVTFTADTHQPPVLSCLDLNQIY